MGFKKEHATRFGTFMLAMLFLVTSIGFSILVIWQVREQNKKEKEQTAAVEQLEQQQGENMLKGTKLSNFTPISTQATDLQIIDITPGTGEEVKPGDTITAHYTGAFAVNGEIFESSKDSGQPATFPLNGVIAGWTEGVPGMKVGGVRRLVIPGAKAYGEAPAGYEPGSTDRPLGTLVFDIELVKLGE